LGHERKEEKTKLGNSFSSPTVVYVFKSWFLSSIFHLCLLFQVLGLLFFVFCPEFLVTINRLTPSWQTLEISLHFTCKKRTQAPNLLTESRQNTSYLNKSQHCVH
jgi:hypothetical protein